MGSRLLTVLLLFLLPAEGYILVPMDDAQTNHLKAYGAVYVSLERGEKVFWLLNYRGGSFVMEDSRAVLLETRKRGVLAQTLSAAEFGAILARVEEENMEKVTLEKPPRIAVYTPKERLPWDDAVTLVLTYAEIPYEKIYDREVLGGSLGEYDWLHLHHEDFTGQQSKFYRSFHAATWYQRQKLEQEKLAADLGFPTIPALKKGVALAIRRYVEEGGFLFAMCSATNTLEIALAALGTDIVDQVYDGDGVDPAWGQKIDFSNTLAFENFSIQTDPMAGNFGNIDVCQVNTPLRVPAMDFELFDFSAKLDPVPCMLVQNHRKIIPGFHGLCTSFRKEVIKDRVVVLASTPGTNRVKYLHGVVGKGQFAFYGGHDPEDYTHAVGDEPTMLEKHPHSPGYRLILNNVLFPAAEKKEKKT